MLYKRLKPNSQRETELNSTELSSVRLSSVQFSAVNWALVECAARSQLAVGICRDGLYYNISIVSK